MLFAGGARERHSLQCMHAMLMGKDIEAPGIRSTSHIAIYGSCVYSVLNFPEFLLTQLYIPTDSAPFIHSLIDYNVLVLVLGVGGRNIKSDLSVGNEAMTNVDMCDEWQFYWFHSNKTTFVSIFIKYCNADSMRMRFDFEFLFISSAQ